MRGVRMTVNNLWGEGAVSCNTLNTNGIPVTVAFAAKAKVGRGFER
jgi:hypothetical protein